MCITQGFMCVLSCVRLLATSWTVARQAPLSMGFSGQESWRGLPFPPSGDLPDPGIEPTSLVSPGLASGFFATTTTWEAPQHRKLYPTLCGNLNEKEIQK